MRKLERDTGLFDTKARALCTQLCSVPSWRLEGDTLGSSYHVRPPFLPADSGSRLPAPSKRHTHAPSDPTGTWRGRQMAECINTTEHNTYLCLQLQLSPPASTEELE